MRAPNRRRLTVLLIGTLPLLGGVACNDGTGEGTGTGGQSTENLNDGQSDPARN